MSSTKPILILFVIALGSVSVASAQEFEELGVKVETVAENLTIPWSIDWLPDGTVIFTERNGNLRMIQNDELVFYGRTGCKHVVD